MKKNREIAVGDRVAQVLPSRCASRSKYRCGYVHRVFRDLVGGPVTRFVVGYSRRGQRGVFLDVELVECVKRIPD